MNHIYFSQARSNRLLRCLLIIFVAVTFAHISYAAGSMSSLPEIAAFTVKGTVTDSSGNPLAGVTVMVKGTDNGTVTDSKGGFSLNITADHADLVFKYLGYHTQEIAVNASEGNVSVIMKAEPQLLNEAVVIGFGTQRKAFLTGAVDQIQAKDIENKPVTNVLQALQ